VPDPGSEPPKESSGKGPGLRTRQRNERREQGHPGQALRSRRIRPFGVLHGRSPRRAQTARGDGLRECAAQEDGVLRTPASAGRTQHGTRRAGRFAGPHRADGPTGRRDAARTGRPAEPDCTRHADTGTTAGRRRGPGRRTDRNPGHPGWWRSASRPTAGTGTHACPRRRSARRCSRASGRPRRGTGGAYRAARHQRRRATARRWYDGSAASRRTSPGSGSTPAGIAGRSRCAASAYRSSAPGQQPVLRSAGHGPCRSAP
jgi:hypothetical protein